MPFNFYNLKFYNFLIPKFTFLSLCPLKSTLVAQMVKNSPAKQETLVQSLGWEDPLAKGMATHSIVLPGEFHAQMSLAGYSPRGRRVRQDWVTFISHLYQQEGRFTFWIFFLSHTVGKWGCTDKFTSAFTFPSQIQVPLKKKILSIDVSVSFLCKNISLESCILFQWKLKLVYHSMKSPFSGTIGEAGDHLAHQPWMFIGRTDTEAKAPLLWPPDGKGRLIWKDPHARKYWRQKEKRAAEDEMVR